MNGPEENTGCALFPEKVKIRKNYVLRIIIIFG